jgi:Putative DNA-binding domain
MPFYTTPVSKLTEADLEELVTDNAVENLRLEFKSEVPKEDQTVKKLSSFANTYGGIMVVGAEEKDGKVTKLSGVPLEPGYKQKLSNWCFIKFNPPLTAEFSEPIRLANGQYCYVISVPESDVAPHFINGRKGVWIRTDEFTNRFRAELANENELRTLFDRRRAIRDRRDLNIQRARKRFDAHVANNYTDAGGHLGDIGTILELCVTPRFPARQLCPYADLQLHLNRAAFNWRGVQFLGNVGLWVTAYESVIVRDSINLGGTSIFSADIWGTCHYATQIAVEVQNVAGQNVTGIHRAAVNGFVMSSLLHAARVLKSLSYFGSLVVAVNLKSVRGKRWLYGTSSAVFDKVGSELDNDISFELPEMSESFYSSPYKLGARILETIYYSTNWSDLVDSPVKLQGIVNEGFLYNNWPMDFPPQV